MATSRENEHSPTFRASKLVANFGATAIKKNTSESEPETRTLRCIKSMLASLGMLDKEVKRIAPDSRRERLQKRVVNLIKALQLCRSSLQSVHLTNSENARIVPDAPGCSYCGCTCKSPLSPSPSSLLQLRSIDLRFLTPPTLCSICNRHILSDSSICEECRVTPQDKSDADGSVALYLKADFATVTETPFARPRLSVSPLSSRRLLKLPSNRLRSISPEPKYMLPVTSRALLKKTEATQTDTVSSVLTVSVAGAQVQYAGQGPYVCKLVMNGEGRNGGEVGHKRSTTEASIRGRGGRSPTLESLQDVLDIGEAGLTEGETLVSEMVNTMEQSKHHYLLPGVADRSIERMLRVFGRLEGALRSVMPGFASAFEMVVAGIVLTCEAVSSSHYEVLDSLEVQKAAEKEAHLKSLTEHISRLQSELVSSKFASTAEIAALKHTVQSYEQRLQTLFAAFKSSKAL